MRNMKVSGKLLFSFAITIALSAVIGVVGIFGMGEMHREAQDMYTVQTQPLPDLAKALEVMQRIRVGLGNAIISTGDTEELESVIANTQARYADFEQYTAAYMATIVDPTATDLFTQAMNAYNNVFKPGVIELTDGALAGLPQAELILLQDAVRPSVDALFTTSSRNTQNPVPSLAQPPQPIHP